MLALIYDLIQSDLLVEFLDSLSLVATSLLGRFKESWEGIRSKWKYLYCSVAGLKPHFSTASQTNSGVSLMKEVYSVNARAGIFQDSPPQSGRPGHHPKGCRTDLESGSLLLRLSWTFLKMSTLSSVSNSRNPQVRLTVRYCLSMVGNMER